MSERVPEKAKVSGFLVFFLIHSMQMGVGVLGFQRIIALHAGYDAWISVLFAGLLLHPVVWMMYKMAGIAGGDIVSIHQYTFGKMLGKWISVLFILYYSLLSLTALRAFIEIIQVWMFQDLSTFWFALAYLLLAIYIINGGFRTVTGIAFLGVVTPFYLIFIFLYTVPFSDFSQLLPIFDHRLKEIATASYFMSFTFLGPEFLLSYYPFLKDPEKSHKWAQGGLVFTTILYLYLTILSFAYFSEGQLQRNVWATLSMFKIVEMPFVERFEYIGIASWFVVILPNICISLWAGTRMLKRTFRVKQKYGVFAISLVCLIPASMLKTREQISHLIDYTGHIGFFLNFGYIPLLLVAVLIAKKVKKNGQKV
jgi:spore germination protein AB